MVKISSRTNTLIEKEIILMYSEYRDDVRRKIMGKFDLEEFFIYSSLKKN